VNQTTRRPTRIAVIGGGITGLTAAYRLSTLRQDLRVELWEATDRLGGVLQTLRDRGYLLERAADNFLRGPTAPWAEQLCQEIGFADQLIPTNEQHRGAHVFWNGRLHAVPAGFQLLAPTRMWPILTSSLLSVRGRLRLCLEPLVPERPRVTDESLAEFARRRLGREAFERLVQPLVSGIYTADPTRLSVAAALPQMLRMVDQYGSLYRAMRRQSKSSRSRQADPSRGARYSLFVTPRGGMSDFVQALAARLGNTTIRHHAQVRRIRRCGDFHWQLHADQLGGAASSTETTDHHFRAVILALPTWAAARVLADLPDGRLASELEAIEHASSAVVCLGYHQQQIQRPLDAFGCVVPAAAGRHIVAISYSSVKFPERAPAGRALLRVFVGGALQPQLAELPERELIDLVRRELAIVLGVEGEPELCHVVRWPRGMPQYHVGHLARVERIRQLLGQQPGLYLASNGLGGVGIPQCVRSGSEAAAQLVRDWDGDRVSEPSGQL
jgi:oxygen-dependent protoporphyrinogen oxidase